MFPVVVKALPSRSRMSLTRRVLRLAWSSSRGETDLDVLLRSDDVLVGLRSWYVGPSFV